jgi:cobalt/nickel transport system permease protein
MHIPDGYLSPQTAVPFVALMVPIWGAAIKKVQSDLKKEKYLYWRSVQPFALPL